MLKLLADEHIDPDLVRRVLARQPELDLIRVHGVGLLGTDDRDILAWAATDGRIFVTHDRNTVPGFAYDRVRAGDPMPGVFVVNDQMPMGRAIDELEILGVCSEPDEWRNQVIYMPM